MKPARAALPKLEDFLHGRIRSLGEVVEFAPDAPRRFVGFAAALFKQKAFRAAELAAELAAHLDDKSAVAWRLLGAACAKQNDFARAVPAYLKALALEPNDAPSWCDLGEVYIATGDYQASAAALKQVVTLDPDASTPHGRRARALIGKTLLRLRGR